MECPCRGCEDRQAECHSRCSAYESWRFEMDELKKKRNEERSLNTYFTDPRRAYAEK